MYSASIEHFAFRFIAASVVGLMFCIPQLDAQTLDDTLRGSEEFVSCLSERGPEGAEACVHSNTAWINLLSDDFGQFSETEFDEEARRVYDMRIAMARALLSVNARSDSLAFVGRYLDDPARFPEAKLSAGDAFAGLGDYEPAQFWYNAAFAAGAPEGALALALLELSSDAGTPDPTAAVRYLELAAGAGLVQALNLLGEALTVGRWTEPDLDRAIEFLRRSTDQGDVTGMVLLANALMEQDPDLGLFEASLLYERAAEAGDPFAQMRIGTWYARGLGVPADRQTAIRWLEQAAEAGIDRAAYELAAIYRTPYGGMPSYPPDEIAEALRWLDQAMAARIPEAFYLAALIHSSGDGGVPRNRQLSEAYLEDAVRYGLPDNFSNRAELLARVNARRAPLNPDIPDWVVAFGIVMIGSAILSDSGPAAGDRCADAAYAAGFERRCGSTFARGSWTGNHGADMWGVSIMMR